MIFFFPFFPLSPLSFFFVEKCGSLTSLVVSNLKHKKDEAKDEQVLSKIKKVPFEEIKKKFEEDQRQKEQQNKQKRKLMLEKGIAYDPFSFVTDNFLFE